MRRSSTYRHANPTYLQMGAARHQHEHVRNRSVFQSARRMVKVGADTRDAPVLRILQCGHMPCTQRQLLVQLCLRMRSPAGRASFRPRSGG
jgi:hypothetical protein